MGYDRITGPCGPRARKGRQYGKAANSLGELVANPLRVLARGENVMIAAFREKVRVQVLSLGERLPLSKNTNGERVNSRGWEVGEEGTTGGEAGCLVEWCENCKGKNKTNLFILINVAEGVCVFVRAQDTWWTGGGPRVTVVNAFREHGRKGTIGLAGNIELPHSQLTPLEVNCQHRATLELTT